jgi:hypothetical protein
MGKRLKGRHWEEDWMVGWVGVLSYVTWGNHFLLTFFFFSLAFHFYTLSLACAYYYVSPFSLLF